MDNQQQQDVIEYLREENRVLHEQLGNKRLRLNDDQRRLAVSAKSLGGILQEWTNLVTPKRHRRLIAQKELYLEPRLARARRVCQLLT